MASLLSVSQKCQYALKALFELSAKYPTDSVTTIEDISTVQNIPPRFLEQILSKLRVSGFIESRRGNKGGYVMTKDPNTVTVGQIIRTVEGHDDANPFDAESVFKDVWEKAQKATNEVFDKTTFQTLIDSRNEWQKRLDFNI